MSALGPCGLAKLPEELVDMVCSFIVSLPDVEDLITTLGSLALTSRRFREPACRALLHDPTRILAIRSAEDAHTLLNRIIQQPALGVQVKSLEGLVDMYDDVEDLSLFHDHPPAFMNWALFLIRLCPNTTAVSIWPDPSAGWLAALADLPRLRHVTVAARADDAYLESDLDDFTPFLQVLPLAGLESLALRGFYGSIWPGLPDVHLNVRRLELAQYGEDWSGLGLCIGSVRHLTLRPDAFRLDAATVLPPALESLVLRPRITQAQLDRHGHHLMCPWMEMLVGHDPFNALRIVVLEGVVMHIIDFAEVCRSAPNLERLELPGTVWHAHWEPDKVDGHLVDALAGLRRLRFLHLGKLPDPPCSILDTRVYCRLFDIELEWRGLELEQVEVSSPSPAAPQSEVSEGGPERSAAEDEPVSDGGGSRLDGWGGDGSSVENEYEVWRLVRAAELDVGFSSPSSTTASPSPSLLARPRTASSSSPSSLLARTSHASLPPRLSPSPTPTLDDGTLSGVVFARTAAAEQRYVAAPAWQPHLEDGYEATDDGVDEGLDEDEPWEGWADECDVSEADKGWREYDDEGEDECVGRLWLVEGEWYGASRDEEASSEEP